MGGIWSFGDQFVGTRGDAIIGTNANSGAEETDAALGGFDVAMDGSIEIIWGVNRGFLLGLAEVLGGSPDVTVWIFFFPVGYISVFFFTP